MDFYCSLLWLQKKKKRKNNTKYRMEKEYIFESMFE